MPIVAFSQSCSSPSHETPPSPRACLTTSKITCGCMAEKSVNWWLSRMLMCACVEMLKEWLKMFCKLWHKSLKLIQVGWAFPSLDPGVVQLDLHMTSFEYFTPVHSQVEVVQMQLRTSWKCVCTNVTWKMCGLNGTLTLFFVFYSFLGIRESIWRLSFSICASLVSSLMEEKLYYLLHCVNDSRKSHRYKYDLCYICFSFALIAMMSHFIAWYM